VSPGGAASWARIRRSIRRRRATIGLCESAQIAGSRMPRSELATRRRRRYGCSSDPEYLALLRHRQGAHIAGYALPVGLVWAVRHRPATAPQSRSDGTGPASGVLVWRRAYSPNEPCGLGILTHSSIDLRRGITEVLKGTVGSVPLERSKVRDRVVHTEPVFVPLLSPA